MVNHLFKLIKNKNAVSFAEEESIDVHALIRCSTEDARRCIPFDLAEKLGILPLAIIEMQNRKLLTAAAGNNSPDLQKSLQFSCGMEVKLIPLNKNILKKAIYLSYRGNDSALTENIHKLKAVSENEAKKHALVQAPTVNCEVNDFLKVLLTYAIVKKASDIHFLPSIDGLRIKLRIDGELRAHDMPVCSNETYKRIVSRIKTLSNLDTTKNETTHDGSLSIDLKDSAVSVRVSIMPTIHGEKIVLRLHGIRDLLKIESLGLDSKTYELLNTSVEKMQGMIICAGSTGSGKSTTLYSILEKISSHNKSIITVEDPVEIKLAFASQTSINLKKGIDYAESLKTALRQDPDCIMIGELRDAESAKIAFHAALTGHLVITSLHAGSVIESMQRLLEFGINKLTLSQTCSLIIYQKLLPRLCGSCKIFDLTRSKETSETVYKAVGCSRCDYSGYFNRAVACETLFLDKNIKDGILNKSSIIELKNLFDSDNYISIEENERDLLIKGQINFPGRIL